MRITTLLPVLLWAAALALGNFQIVSSTDQKISEYHHSPPFRIGSLTNAKNLSLVLDSKEDTFWERKAKRQGESDFFLEMKLTHYFDGDSFSPYPVKQLEWVACPGKALPHFQAKLFLRESINVDKELRLPEDRLIASYKFDEINKHRISRDISGIDHLKQETNYPNGIFIYTLEMTLPNDISINDCFAEIKIKE